MPVASLACVEAPGRRSKTTSAKYDISHSAPKTRRLAGRLAGKVQQQHLGARPGLVTGQRQRLSA